MGVTLRVREGYDFKRPAFFGVQHVSHDAPVDGAVIKRFQRMEEMQLLYHSPAYQAALTHRPGRVDCRGLIVEGATRIPLHWISATGSQ